MEQNKTVYLFAVSIVISLCIVVTVKTLAGNPNNGAPFLAGLSAAGLFASGITMLAKLPSE